MNNEAAITSYTNTQALTSPITNTRPVWSVDLAIELWLDAKFKHSGSSRTRHAYEVTLQEFRAALQFRGLDLESVSAQSDRVTMQVTRDKVKQLAQVFAGFSKRGRQVKESTINHRLSVISSFYGFCVLNEWLDYNPIEHLERSKVEPYAGVKSLDFDEVAASLDRLDMHDEQDVRDNALLAILLQTGRRASEVAGLRWKHATVRKGLVTLFFERCKGNKTAQDELSKEASTALLRWLHMHYGSDLARLAGDTPLFVSLARGTSYGHALSIQAIGQICLKHLGTSKVHATRHTFVMGMFEAGASPRQVQAKLLHSSLHTTSLYGDKLQSAKNEHAGKLSQLFGIK
ncbi:MAG: tyrosine-type recombinase/integrase [Ktedonobacteraceae bacterium]